jgi:hypothetical protein
MNALSSSCAAVLFFALGNPAFGWGADGHEVVGSIADQLLVGHPAKAQVDRILGFELKVAAPWLDCVRSVVHHTDGAFEYSPDPNHPEYTAACHSFETPAEKARMEDYVRRNWSNCFYKLGHGCHETYHFADVAVLHDRYDPSFAGTSEHDIVSTIKAAVAVLKNQSAPAPFAIADKKEALILLAHVLGDLHQPLHVGAVYLDSRGNRLNPDDEPDVDPEADTAGGNFLHDERSNLHSEWDKIPTDFGNTANEETVRAAAAVPMSSGELDDWPAAWASDSILAAQKAFTAMTFTKHGPENWAVHFTDRNAYLHMKDQLQREQLAKAGAHLAELLKAIWP